MLPFSSGNILVSFATLIAAFLCYIVLAFIVIPLWKMSFYKKQGIPCYFFPFLGPIFRAQKYAKKFNDSMALPREQAKQDQNLQAEIINFGSHLGIILCDAKIIREFYAHQSDYKKSPFTSDLNLLLGTGLVIAEGDVWKSHRKIISSVFHFDFIKQNIPLIVTTTREFLQEMAKKPLSSVNVMDEIQKITGEVVGRIFFGENLNQYTCRGQILTLYLAQILVKCAFGSKSFLTMILHLMGINSDWIPQNRRVLNEIKDFRNLCLKIVQDRKKSNVQTQDLLGLLIKTQASPNPEDRFSDNDIVNEFITFFIAGMDTTGHVVAMALYLLDKNPEYKNTMIEEIEKIYKKTNSNSITVDEINQMEMTHAVVKETLRLYTPVPALFPRRATADHELLGIKIKKGMSVRTRLLYNFANPKYFEDPDSFKPDRWLNKRQQALDGFVDIPFSAGARNCIGQHLAMIESKIILAEFMKLFTFKVVPEDYQLVMAFNFLYEPKSKIQMDLKLR